VRAVVVTGASSGIGAACVATLAEHGFFVYAGVRSDAAAQRAEASHRNVRALRLDVTDAAQIEAAARTVRDANAELAGLVNNAGLAFGGPLETLPLDELRAQLEVNVVGALAVTQAFLPQLRAHRARVVFVGSIAGRVAMPYLAPYAASKFALRALADALRLELRPAGVRVCLIEPGSVATPIWQKGLATRDALLARLGPSAPSYYRDAIEAVMHALAGEERSGMPVARVATAVLRALTDRKPKAHVILGMPARIGAILALLPTSLHDRFIRATMKLP